MTTVLHINASGTTDGSLSRAATKALLQGLRADTVITRDLAATPLPQVDGPWITSRLVPAEEQTPSDHATLALSNTLVAELQKADIVLIGMPVYNFGMPAALKAWVDLVARPRVTFSYGPDGPVGLLNDKRAVVAVSSGGTQVDGLGDFATPHLRQVLGFLGVSDVTVYAAKDVTAPEPA